MKLTLSLFTPALALLFFLLPQTNDWQNKVEPSVLEELDRDGYVSFILLFEAQADVSLARQQGDKVQMGNYVFERTKKIAAQSQKQAIEILKAQQSPYRSYHIVNAIHAKGSQDLVRQLARLPEVKAVQPNPTIAIDLLPEDREEQGLNFREGVEWGIAAIGADQLWSLGYTGEGVVIGGQDTGYEWDHPAIQGTYRGWDGSTADHNYNWHDAIHEIDSMNGPPYVAEANPCGLSGIV
ncbi:MAG: hypothetical protein HRU12_11610, partial [Phaeodactylibacter sp.]|nr:hypothetical protein [Phaeodactylibacter sp.]